MSDVFPLFVILCCLCPDGKQGMSDVLPLSGILGLSFDPPPPSPPPLKKKEVKNRWCLLSCSCAPSCGSFCLVPFLLMAHPPDFVIQSFSISFVKRQAFISCKFCLTARRWYMIMFRMLPWHWYMPLCMYVLINLILSLSIPLKKKSFCVDKLDDMFFLMRTVWKALTLWKCVMIVYVCFLIYFILVFGLILYV